MRKRIRYWYLRFKYWWAAVYTDWANGRTNDLLVGDSERLRRAWEKTKKRGLWLYGQRSK